MTAVVTARRRTDVSARLAPLATVACLLLLWELLARLLEGSYLLAGPIAVAIHIQANAGLLARALGVTLEAAALGFIYGNLAALLLALLVFSLPRAERLFAYLALFFFCLPFVATGPILRVFFGPGIAPQVTLAALAVYFPTYLTLMVGLRAAPAGWFDLVRSYGRGRWTELFRVRARASLPYFIAGLQIAAPAAILGAMVGEFTGAERGLGVLSIRAMRALDVDATWALATIAASVSMIAYAAVGWLGRRLDAAPPPLLLAPPQDDAMRRDPNAWTGHLVTILLVVAAVLAIWTLSMEALGLNVFFAKRPWHVWEFLVSAPAAPANRAELFSAFGETLTLAIPGYVLGLAFGAGLAALTVAVPSLAALILPLAISLRSIPIITTAPLIVLALGRGAVGTITIVALMIFFPTLVACIQGLRQAPGQIMDVFDSYAARRWDRLAYAQLPAMLPALFASARIAVPAALLAATTAEWLATGTGIGSLMAVTASTSGYSMLWSSILLVAAFASAAYLLIATLERRVLTRYATEQLRA